MNTKTLVKISLSTALLAPLFAYAANVTDILQQTEIILNRIIPILMIIATIVFLWGVIRYITASGEEEKLAEGRRFIVFGLIGLFVMVAIWGVVRALVSQFGVGGGIIPPGPGDIRPSP
ncbi:MAG: hypothetical protein UW81_C0017G0028 [Candidatus Giovannonibacteria bacterium GW2011_GWC2_44_9]|uniref:Uncharacterized protein n=3 Tax=Candidatus Giovannoniibacteriota TaxID=1752738 RepID=A0A0G1LUB1_9BACT|nr:MAG: hypothetical protein UW49_C0014G0009 [Candidatus Giovannonibacteria bacterium GW2011_GWB1_44_23]KKT63274.1 MAG: hypothetical protein UW57_C0009G0010 [Candidatus Giovannonibacteria bacterium GW2011_GWA1_44_29]KKT83504.1 MAG: hypothetical protein UW81_C0017G0028 [Candidatus Giovannonibacteria bacterium GW2011_GWC2_44_9]KKT91240.1 MAG: hypothetical protein UW93_C0010G0012 [Parcubacteria group bacterium GW2011_GWC1_45_13]